MPSLDTCPSFGAGVINLAAAMLERPTNAVTTSENRIFFHLSFLQVSFLCIKYDIAFLLNARTFMSCVRSA